MDDIRSGIEGLAARVGRLIPGTEEQFLFIGSRLNEVYTEVEKISRQASSLVSMLDSSVMKGTIGRFREILERMDRHIGGSDRRFASGMAALNDVLAAVSRVGDPLANFRKIVKTLKILAISTKIESAQLKKMESDFVNLAGDVEQLSALIHDKSAGIESHRRSLMSLTEETLARIVSINEKSRGYISEVLGNIRSSIELLESRHDLSFSAADSMLGRFNATSKQVGEVVMSMQFHDITRQQVEHIRDVLTSMEGRLYVSPRGADDDRADVGPVTAELVAEAAIACELQKAQLSDAEKKFVHAVDAIVENLQGVVKNVFRILDDIQKITGGTDLIASTFLSNIESGTTAVIGRLEDTGRAEGEFVDAMGELSSAVSTISGLVDDIEEIGEEIELIAVNARVKSAHTGVEGAPLGVIAEAIWHLSIDATSQKITISDLLREVVTATQGLQAAVRERTADADSDSRSIIGELSGLLDELKGMNDGVVGLVKEIEGGSRNLSGLIEETIENISVHRDLKREVSGLEVLFDEVIATARRAVSHEELEKARGRSLDYIESNYTMQRERIIHQSVASNVIPFTGKERGGAAPPQTEEDHACADDLGDNVELF
ncbi:MAG: Methyl-accepting chemotaxis protein (MCP) signaling domain protein [Syntrophorhabdus sp. PtaB.Bin047]|nr:MAG: Methyl-accepting chemotaxis protein (MCP) signaling domain protein [Syntrophorhabdus sp. PtaB.Bin047]